SRWGRGSACVPLGRSAATPSTERPWVPRTTTRTSRRPRGRSPSASWRGRPRSGVGYAPPVSELESVPFADEHVAGAAKLLAARHARHRAAEPLLADGDPE